MAWECAECVIETMVVVCHHCAKPLCEKDAEFIRDGAFSDGNKPVSDWAAHCRECKDHYHPVVRRVWR